MIRPPLDNELLENVSIELRLDISLLELNSVELLDDISTELALEELAISLLEP